MAYKTLAAFYRDFNKLLATLTRQEMNRDIQAFAITRKGFKDLAKRHISELKKLATRIDDPVIKEMLDSTPGINKLALQLEKRFIELFEHHLYRRENVLDIDKQFESNNTVIYYIKQKTKTKGGAFRVLQKIIRDVKKDLIKNSISGGGFGGGSTDKALSIVVGGIDAELEGLGGLTSQLNKKKELDTNPVLTGKEGKFRGQGAELGHTRGAAIVTADRLVRLVEQNLTNSIKHAGILTEVRRLRDVVQEVDSEFALNSVVIDLARKKLNISSNISVVTLEQTALNRASGGLARQALDKLRAFVEANADVLLEGAASKPLLEEIVKQYEQYFVTGKTKKVTRNKKLNKPLKVRAKVKTKGPKISTRTNTAAQAKLIKESSSKNPAPNLQGLIALLNNKLHDQIKANMGGGTANERLNYQTGRFAKSAKVEALYEVGEKNAIGAQVSYLKYPYGVFEKGGRLYKPLRDPQVIFGRSIRQILADQKIANLRRVKVRTNG